MTVTHAALSLSAPADARACSFGFREHFISPDEVDVDQTPPAAPVFGDVEFNRDGMGSCSGTGTIGIHIAAATDDRTAEADMGYVIKIVDGVLPDGIFLPTEPVLASEDGMIYFPFSDHDQAIDVTFAVRARDLGGNIGEPALVQAIDDVQEAEGFGCSAGTSAGSTSLALVMLALAMGLRQRRGAFRE